MTRRWAWLLVVLPLLVPATSRADGLRLSFGFAAMNFTAPDGSSVNLYYTAVTARVARGRAGLSFSVPVMGISGGRIALSDENFTVEGGNKGFRSGLGDMSVGLDYNIYQDRAKMIIVTLGGTLRFPTSSTALELGTGEHLLGLGLSGIYGITKQLLAFADVRNAWAGILSPTVQRALTGELGAIYWFTDKLGVSASLLAASYVGLAKPSLEFNIGVNYELFPGFMTNLTGIGGLFGGAPRGISFGFGFEL